MGQGEWEWETWVRKSEDVDKRWASESGDIERRWVREIGDERQGYRGERYKVGAQVVEDEDGTAEMDRGLAWGDNEI